MAAGETTMNKLSLKRFDSPEDYRGYLTDTPSKFYSPNLGDWGGGSWQDVIDKLIMGDTACLEQAEKIIQQMQDAQIFTQNLPIMQSAIVGAVPNVPAMLSNHPKSMFMRQHSETISLSTPLTVYVETTVSGGVTNKQLTSRGIAALAFVLAMSAIRPVEIYAVSAGYTNETSILVTKIASAPMDLARATWMLTSPGYARLIAFAAMNKLSDCDDFRYIGWGWNSQPKNYEDKLREALEANQDDVIIQGGHLFDTLMLNDPITWVKQMIEKHNTRELA